MAGQRQKPRGELAYKRGGRDRTIETIEERPAVAVVDLSTPEGLTPEAAYVWDETVWLAKDHLVPSDMFRLRRWIWWVDRWVKEVGELTDEPSVVRGSMGQPTRNPRFAVLETCERHIVAGEAVMGLNPQARMRLGMSIQQGEQAWRQLKADRDAVKPTPVAQNRKRA